MNDNYFQPPKPKSNLFERLGSSFGVAIVTLLGVAIVLGLVWGIGAIVVGIINL